MRRLLAAVLAVPVLASLYLAIALSHRGARRAGVGLVGTVGVAMVAVIAIGLASPTPSVSLPPSQPSALPQAQFQPVATFSDASAMAGAHGAAGTAGAPFSASSAVGAITGQAVGHDGVAAGVPAVASVTIRQLTAARLTPSRLIGNRLALTAGFLIRFDRSVSLAVVRKSFTIKPAVKGSLTADPGSTTRFVFSPATPLAPETRYTVSFVGRILDAQGQPIVRPAPHAYLTIPSTSVLRFRPFLKSTGNDPTSAISVRFSQPMDPTSTAKAFTANIAGRKLAGMVIWAENHTVLVFQPAHALPSGAGVGVRVTTAARSLAGAPLVQGVSFTFKVAAKSTTTPTAKPVTTRATGGSSNPKPSSGPSAPPSGGGSVGGGSWAAVESFYLSLMNCTRTGGWVQSDGTCSNPGGRDVAPLWIDHGISDNVTRPYA
ncbi:MAG TPA: Ig-like domain-containing protein, partial [Candidatus Saccharimonadales bacterium]|nr:Ig-like domain-containing protein [Candidatus Saccharimonadales bacterium]